MTKIIKANARFIYKSKALEEWQSENPILLKGEIGFVSDIDSENFVKIGDGITPWNSLPYKTGPKGEKGDTAPIDQSYNPNSENPQSGKAVCEALENAELENYVKKTDIATSHNKDSGNLGLVRARLNDGWGEGIEIDTAGYIKTKAAGTGDIYNQTNGHRPITPNNISYAVKVGLANSKAGYSDEEKQSARNLIGAAAASDILNMLTLGCITANANYQTAFDLEPSTLYLFWYNGSTNSLQLKVTNSSATAQTAIDAVGDELPSFQAGAIIIPKDITQEGDEYYEKRRCMFFGYTGKTLGIPQIATKQFYYDNSTNLVGDKTNVNYGSMTVANDTAGLVSVWKIKL